MSYFLATTETKVRWYKFPIGTWVEGQYELINELDLKQVPAFGDKETAKRAALALGLKVWRYVRI